MNDKHWAAIFCAFVSGIAATLTLRAITAPPAPPPMPEEQRKEITAQPPVELWGWQAETLNPSELVTRPFVVMATDAGMQPFFPANFAEAQEPQWQRHGIVLTVWAKGDQASMQRLLLRWAEEAHKAATHDDLKH